MNDDLEDCLNACDAKYDFEGLGLEQAELALCNDICHELYLLDEDWYDDDDQALIAGSDRGAEGGGGVTDEQTAREIMARAHKAVYGPRVMVDGVNVPQDAGMWDESVADEQLAALAAAGYAITAQRRMSPDDLRLAMKLALREHAPCLEEHQMDYLVALLLQLMATDGAHDD